jgi:hypothetical protein
LAGVAQKNRTRETREKTGKKREGRQGAVPFDFLSPFAMFREHPVDLSGIPQGFVAAFQGCLDGERGTGIEQFGITNHNFF